MKVYGSAICIDCRNFKAVQAARGIDAQFVDITENTANLKEFLHLRDTNAAFANTRQNGGIGIPAFVNDDGAVTLDLDTAMAWIGQPPVAEDELPEKRPEMGCDSCN